jgi:hypothetical protein
MFVGAVVLADALIDLANHDDLAADVVERLSSDPQELIKKGKLPDSSAGRHSFTGQANVQSAIV